MKTTGSRIVPRTVYHVWVVRNFWTWDRIVSHFSSNSFKWLQNWSKGICYGERQGETISRVTTFVVVGFLWIPFIDEKSREETIDLYWKRDRDMDGECRPGSRTRRLSSVYSYPVTRFRRTRDSSRFNTPTPKLPTVPLIHSDTGHLPYSKVK